VWEKPHSSIDSSWIFADASVHRIISDLSVFVGRQTGHLIVVAGDFNILYGYGENGSPYWASRYETVFARMSSLGLTFIGPQAPAGRLADPWPDELPRTSINVPTYHHNRQTPNTATRQLDFVFGSAPLSDRIRVTALNKPDQWGPSDHCCVEIEID
jgi:endonuclease/exonuclease/phosphatase family metal-dependent hydrolase